MGYSTDFKGSFQITPGLTLQQKLLFEELFEDDQRDKNNDWAPGYHCQWEVSEDGTQLVWDQMEKFDMYIEWLKVIVEHFMKPQGCALTGEVMWAGEQAGDTGIIRMVANHITVQDFEKYEKNQTVVLTPDERLLLDAFRDNCIAVEGGLHPTDADASEVKFVMYIPVDLIDGKVDHNSEGVELTRQLIRIGYDYVEARDSHPEPAVDPEDSDA